MDEWGFGLASVRFICGTQDLHVELERRVSAFLGTEDTILFSSCFDANGGVFEALFGAEDAIISDELNHASLIDGIRLSKARRLRYRNRDLADLEEQLKAASRRPPAHHRDRRRVLDGRLPRSPAGNLRPCRALRRTRARRRLARGGLHGRAWSRHARVDGRRGPRRHLHGHVRQGARRRVGRLRLRAQGNRGDAAPARPPLPVLQHRGARP